MKIDSHQHFWKYQPVRDAWITNEMKSIQRDFMPEDLLPLLEPNGFEGCIAVQADQSEEETYFLLDLAKKNDFIKGVIGWVDLRSEDIEARLEHFATFNKLKGFRHIIQAEPNADFLLGREFCRGISFLKRYQFTYDVLIKPHHLKTAIHFVQQFPDQPFVIDHLAKPFIRDQFIEEWEKEIQRMAEFNNVYCKISGLVTEASWQNWKMADFKKYIGVVIENFGIKRVMFGSDWPVCLLAASYKEVCEVVEENTAHLSLEEKQLLWELNAKRFYHL